MVQIDPKEWERQKNGEDPLSEVDRSIVRRSRRLDLPLSDALTVRFVAEVLKSLAIELDAISRRGDLPLRSQLFEAGWLISGAQHKINDRVGTISGRRPSFRLRGDYHEAAE